MPSGDHSALRSAALAAALLFSGCAFSAPPADPPAPARGMFDAEVYPLLLRDCGFVACHGSRDRFFRVFGPGRTRLDPTSGPYDPATLEERNASYDRARSMLASAGRAEDTLLLRKPLEVDRGGAPHMGIDGQGRDVYGSVEAEGYALILSWARTGFVEDP